MNLQSLIQNLRIVVHDRVQPGAATAIWTDSDMTFYLNAASNIMVSVINNINEEFFTNIVTFETKNASNQPDGIFTLPANYGGTRLLLLAQDSLFRQGVIELPRIFIDTDYFASTPTQPRGFIIRNGKIELIPFPDKIYFIKWIIEIEIPQLQNTTDIPFSNLIPERFHIGLVWKAAELMLGPVDPMRGTRFQDNYNMVEKNLISFMRQYSGETAKDPNRDGDFIATSSIHSFGVGF